MIILKVKYLYLYKLLIYIIKINFNKIYGCHITVIKLSHNCHKLTASHKDDSKQYFDGCGFCSIYRRNVDVRTERRTGISFSSFFLILDFIKIICSSTLQLFNSSTLQLFNSSTLQLFNSSTLQLFNSSTLQLLI